MSGPSKRKGSEVWQFRKGTPVDLLREAPRLKKMGYKVPAEETRSLKTKDHSEAVRRYRRFDEEVEEKWARWRNMLSSAPVALTSRDQFAIAGQWAKGFVEKHSDDPQAIKSWSRFVEITADNIIGSLYPGKPSREKQSIFDLSRKLMRIHRLDLESEVCRLLASELIGTPRQIFLKSLYEGINRVSEVWAQGRAKEELVNRGLLLDPETARGLREKILVRQVDALNTLNERRLTGNYSEPEWMRGIPEFKGPATPPPPKPETDSSKFLDLFDLLEGLRKAKGLSTRTYNAYEGSLRSFERFAGHRNAWEVTKPQARAWRDLMMEGKLHPATINKKHLAALKSVLSRAVNEHDLPTNPAMGVRDERPPPPQETTDYSMKEVQTILQATFNGSRKDHIAPHRRAIFWLPWIMAYTGLRAGEVAQIGAENLKEERVENLKEDEDGIFYFQITPKDGSTKKRNTWVVPLHKHLIELGLVEMMRAIGQGPVFYEVNPKSDLPPWETAYRKVDDWIKDEVGITPPLGNGNHAFRHTVNTLSRGGGKGENTWEVMNVKARDYMMGKLDKSNTRERYGGWRLDTLAAEIGKLPRYQVTDTGWRPE